MPVDACFCKSSFSFHRLVELYRDSFERKFKAIEKGLKELSLSLAYTNIMVSTQDCRSLKQINSASVEYVFTDPPYADKVQYGELNFVWEAWLGFDTN